MQTQSKAASAPATIELPAWFWLWLPIALYLLHVVAAAVLPYETYNTLFTSELGVSEEGTTLILAAAMMLGALVTWHFATAARGILVFWFLLFTLGCLYFGGEEASWGQHWFGWQALVDWRALNEQKELNLHNTEGLVGSLLDQLPRNLLTLGALVGGSILPLVRRWRAGRSEAAGPRAGWMLPTCACVPSGLVASLSSVPEKIQEAYFSLEAFNMEAGEVKELMLALFLLTYALSVWVRLRRRGAGISQP